MWVTDIARDGTSLVGHTTSYVQVLLPGGGEERERLMGRSALVRITSTSRWSCQGEVLEVMVDMCAINCAPDWLAERGH